MTRLTRLCRAVGVGLAVATATLGMTQAAEAAPAPSDVPTSLAPPTGNEQFLVGHAKGVQIYTCKAVPDGSTTFKWVFAEPRATLTTDNGRVIKHSKGPKWAVDADGSGVIRDPDPKTVVKSENSPAPDRDIPWLLVPVAPAPDATNDPGDLLTGTTFIQRINTKGGTQPPTAECKAQTAGKVKEVPYKADYVFFKAAARS